MRSDNPFEPSWVLPRLVANGLTPEERGSVMQARHLASTRQPAASSDPRQVPVCVLFKDYIDEIFVYDENGMRTWIMQSDLQEWGLSVEELHAYAVENLIRRLKDEDFTVREKHSENHISFWGDIVSSMMLVEDTWKARDSRGESVYICAPRRDVAFMSFSFGDDDRAWLASVSAPLWGPPEERGSLNLTDEIFHRGPSTNGSWILLPSVMDMPN